VWRVGTLAGLFAPEFGLAQTGVQGIGIAAAFLWTFPMSYAALKPADAIVGIRLRRGRRLNAAF